MEREDISLIFFDILIFLKYFSKTSSLFHLSKAMEGEGVRGRQRDPLQPLVRHLVSYMCVYLYLY